MFFDNPGLLPETNAMPQALDWAKLGRKDGASILDIYVEDGSFLKIDNITLGYNLPLKQNKYAKAIKFTVTGNNLYTFTKYTGLDPESSYDGLAPGIDQYNTYPKTRSISFGISATFN